jgi:drug/metabolite transporter (DMT)-like permease
VGRSYAVLLLSLSAIWGASYLFIKVGVRDLQPAAFVELRLLVTVPVLVGFLFLREGVAGAVRDLRGAAVPGLVLGTINAAVPFVLIAWGERHIDSGVAAIANATVPLFNFLLALRFAPTERIGGARFSGLIVGIAGVAVLAGLHPRGGWWAVAGTLAVVLASLLYAAGGIFGQQQTARRSGPVLAAATVVYGAVVVLPFALFQLPGEAPGWKSLASAVALGVAGTGIAQLLLFRMLRLHGSARTSLVTYLLPLIAVIYGSTLLGEPLTAEELGGMALIFVGVGIASGLLRLPRRAPLTQTP